MGTKTHNNYEDLITFTRASAGHALRPVSYGTELITSGTFDDSSALDDWTTTGNVTASVSNGEVTISGDGGYNDGLQQVFNTTVGAVYSVTVTGRSITGNVTMRVRELGGTYTTIAEKTFTSTSNETVTLSFTAISSQSYVQLMQWAGSAGSGVFDNVSIKEVTFDQPDGTLTLFEHPENVPRVEWDSAGNRLGLLVEESRTNLTTISEPTLSDLSNSGNVSDGDFGNSLGLSNGIAFGDNSVTRFAYRSATVSSGQDYVVSVFVKMDDGSAPNVGNGTTSGDFGLVIGSSLVTSASNISVTAMSDNVYRVSGTRTASSTDSQHGVIKYTGQSAKGFTITGFQIEQASFGSSYIKTTGATATRSADVASLPVADFGYNQSEGTVFVELQHFDTRTGSKIATGIGFGDGTTNNRMWYYQNKGQWIGASGGVSQFSMTGSEPSENTPTKFAGVFKTDDFTAYIDGTSIGTDSSGSVPTVPTLFIGYSGTSNSELNGHIKSIKYYPRRLTNAQLVELTS